MRRFLSVLLTLCLLFCAPALAQEETQLTVDMSKWQYNAQDGVYWQVGIAYCASPVDLTYETLGIFVPERHGIRTDGGALGGILPCHARGRKKPRDGR